VRRESEGFLGRITKGTLTESIGIWDWAMLNQPQTSHLPGIAQVLIMEQLINEEDARREHQTSVTNGSSFIQHLVSNRIIEANPIAIASAKSFGVALLDLNCYDRDSLPAKLINEKMVRRHLAMPLFLRGDRLYVAMDDPSKTEVINEIKFQTGMMTYPIVVESDKLHKLIEEVLSAKQNEALSDYVGDDQTEVFITSEEEEDQGDATTSAEDAPVVRFINKILLDAVHKGASDIHFEPYENKYRIRFRQDGILYEVAAPPNNLSLRISARIKVMSSLDISERRIPQDGRFKMRIAKNNSIDFRVSTCPTVNGEKIVMRILDPASAHLGIEALGFNAIQREIFMKTIHQPQGMVLVTGPTGSGKTVTLYTALNILNTSETNISTAEDPVEIKLPGVNQVNINLKTGLTFANTLRAFLRQDPDVIMVGEMRDLETAEIGIKAAQTGHMVLSTLHTNSAAETLTRLVNMGVAPYNIAGSVNLIIAQRLARRLCEHCKIETQIPIEELRKQGFSEEEIPNVHLFKPKGCEYCTNGYKGRVGLYETLVLTKGIGEIMMRGGSSSDIEKQALIDGLITIRSAGLTKVREGVTSLEEIYRVSKE